jgi:hypothetical protein
LTFCMMTLYGHSAVLVKENIIILLVRKKKN